jgi:putative DNA primase/helicase
MGGHLVVVGEVAVRPENSAAFASVPPAIVRAGPDVVRAELSRVALFTKGGVPIPVPHDVADTITGRAATAGMPRLRTVRPFPLLREDGSVALTPGYDRVTNGSVTIEWSDLALPNAPTRADAKAALAVLLEPFDDFPMHPQEGRAALAAYILAPFVRHLVPTVPLFAASAPTAGSGKTLLVQAAGAISLGAPPALMAALSGPSADEETRKRFTAQLLAGRGDMILDNVPRDRVFGSPALDALLTSPVWSDRVLGSSTSAPIPNTATVAVTGNNMQMAPDTARRTIWAYLDAKVARPEERQGFKYLDLLGHIAKERPRLVKAALTVLRAYTLHADPFRGGAGQARVLGSFEGWSRVIAAAVEWSGLPNPISTQDFGRGLSSPGDDELDALETLFGALTAVFGSQPFTAGEALKAGGITGAELEPVPPAPSGGGNVASGPSDAAQATLGAAIRTTLGSRGGTRDVSSARLSAACSAGRPRAGWRWWTPA